MFLEEALKNEHITYEVLEIYTILIVCNWAKLPKNSPAYSRGCELRKILHKKN